MGSVSIFILPGIVFLFSLASGKWLSNSGKPYKTGIFTIHKLVSLGAAVLLAIQIFNVTKAMSVPSLMILLATVTALAIAALFATGALMSMDKPTYKILHTVHRIASILAVGAIAIAIYFLTNSKP
jgi:hypothetical protein